MSLVTCPRCRGPMFDCVCPERLDANPPRLVDDPAVSPDDPLRTAAEALGATPTGDEAPDDAPDDATVKVWARLVAHVTKGVA